MANTLPKTTVQELEKIKVLILPISSRKNLNPHINVSVQYHKEYLSLRYIAFQHRDLGKNSIEK